MSDEVTLGQLAAEIGQLRQQIETLSQRLDMIYGAVARLADARQSTPAPASTTPKEDKPAEQPVSASPSVTGAPLSANMMMDPGSMLNALHQYALKLGMDIPPETVDFLKSDRATGETPDEPK
jgi:hypothetical protein